MGQQPPFAATAPRQGARQGPERLHHVGRHAGAQELPRLGPIGCYLGDKAALPLPCVCSRVPVNEGIEQITERLDGAPCMTCQWVGLRENGVRATP